ncbi:MAG: hypothetical protein A3H52_00705 [Candidatus Zambryskibacteria bacterium RIFCSPLOWO2_02_FULL_39_26]|uniref:Uncharacterized protein n=1 Tax=Candidatus Zambryskibacteria bacterium RIFCSPLOWO2_12_FULL_39_23 TaxID=1802776 RepID=A0A1G2UT57_9BACT|nr:MAG: hypothetical protein A2W51_00625 [Candidatus Zambryskibacteria bacterium RIFCSPHIGHO2_02_39_10]OHB10240.1 MAG: hypothetical protein A3H52_00705 [Candidatus Zambryskibacteria bacterium RIFCSPLOWO2_02_FULL_39_26]OHB12580.1 MAG: hypothetical protein A3G99_02045 [Candidatus Zambryskibacteria bacterium RIFCSPLOWO2_12_FULL_39_23]
MRRTLFFTLIAGFWVLATPTAQQTQQGMAEQFLSKKQKPLLQYVALRHLEASNAVFAGSLEVLTTQLNKTFTYVIISEKGNSYIRNSILREFLQGEKKLIERGQDLDNSFSLGNYTVGQLETVESGWKLPVKPRRNNNLYKECSLFINYSGDILRSNGRVKSPSFWLYNVVIDTTFNQINDVRMPISFKSTAQVLFFGRSKFQMDYTYTSVNFEEVIHK